MAERKEALLGDFFASHPGPATRDDCIAALVERYRISEPRARQWLEHALEVETLVATDEGILPRDLAPAEAVAHVLASRPEGLRWAEVVERVVASGVCPSKPARQAVRREARVVVSGDGVLRHSRFGVGVATGTGTTTTTTTPTTTTTTTSTSASASAPAKVRTRTVKKAAPEVAVGGEAPPVRQMPIVRRRRVAEEAEASSEVKPRVEVASEPRPVRLLRAIDAALGGSARAIEIDALRETVAEETSLDVGLGEIRSLVIAHAAAKGWHVRGGLVSQRRIPWADLDDAVAAAARGHRRDPAELVARVRRLVRISSATAAHLRRRFAASGA